MALMSLICFHVCLFREALEESELEAQLKKTDVRIHSSSQGPVEIITVTKCSSCTVVWNSFMFI